MNKRVNQSGGDFVSPAREVPEWIGKSPDCPIPPRVRLRVFTAHKGVCHISGRRIRPADKWDCDHVVALVNGGEHRETNLAPALRDKHREKTAADVAIKAKTARIQARHLGVKPKSRLTHPKLKRRFDGTVVER